MDIYPHMLKAACETWFKTHYAGVYHKASLRIVKSASTQPAADAPRELPQMELKVSVGPWQSIYVWFKAPGVVMSKEEKESMNELRSQGCRVAIVRHLEDFKTLVQNLLHASQQVF